MKNSYTPKAFGALIGKSVNTLQKWDRNGSLTAYRTPTNRRYYTHEQYLEYCGLHTHEQAKTVAYLRIFNPIWQGDLARQKKAINLYCQDNNLSVDDWFEDIGNVLDYERKQFNALLEAVELGSIRRIIIIHQDRFALFGFNWFEAFCLRHNTEIVNINKPDPSPAREAAENYIASLSMFSTQLPGLRIIAMRLTLELENALRRIALEQIERENNIQPSTSTLPTQEKYRLSETSIHARHLLFLFQPQLYNLQS